MAGNSGGRDEGRLRRRSLLEGVGALGVTGLAGCIRSNDIEADGPAEELIQEGFEATEIEPPFETTIAITEGTERSRFAELLEVALEDTGFFDVSVSEYKWTTYLDRLNTAAANDANALFIVSWTGGWDPDDYVNVLFHSENHTPDGLNINHYTSDTVDDYIDNGLEETDPDERVDIYRQLQEHLVADSPVSFVRVSEASHVWNADAVSGWRAYPLESGTYNAVYAPWAGVYTDLDGDEFVGDLGSDISATDPVSMNDTASSQATQLVYEGLTGVDFDGSVRPVLAEEWEQLDATTYRFTLRDGVQFHNGEELTADHVKKSFERYEGTPRESDVYDWYETIDIVDDRTMDVHCWREYGPFEKRLFDLPIVPMAAIDGDRDLESEPIGTGPYRFADYQPGDHWRLERFDDYWFGGSEGVPATPPAETVRLEIITEAASRQGALEVGDIDFSSGVPSASLSDLAADDAYGVDRRIGGGFDMVIYPLYHGPFTNELVRRGCNMLIPRRTILEDVYHGLGRPAYVPISPLLEDYTDEAFEERIAEEYVQPT
ncbi:ABC transporter substrate-binding protein [Natrinema salsiterrestre]|uniref:ABC transporter substrate-binding protein n=1 Tax=Natrinema salsiterrestre TaxID=2950540 RepID=A0A9Q4Q064_9EURY|nr:ABC transporter substrate-binding protein [Natrinema salsiterrestre]MDF9745439.1 ABC transporter substrate-binding protein [Natrinema salsiterrestre]